MAAEAQTSRTFRVFVSSTFEDFKAERNALQEFVFPRLAELCEQRGARFQAIDLRWGVSDEASLDQRAMEICLTEIKRCQAMDLKPNFIVLMGNRYGWRPLPSRIEAGEFEQIRDVAEDGDRELLDGWYVLDENADPAECILRPRDPDVHDEADYDSWNETEAKLRTALLGSVKRLGWPADDRRMAKYVASATEQEILRGALDPDDADKHVFAFLREIEGLPADASAKGFRDMVKKTDGTLAVDDEAANRLAALKKALKDKLKLPDHVFEYAAPWQDAVGTADGELPRDLDTCRQGLRDLCRDVWQSMSAMVESELERSKPQEGVDPEPEAHRRFGQNRCADFVGREPILATVTDYLAANEPAPLVLVGEGGSGKSAIMAKSVEEARGTHEAATLIERYVGATPGSSDGRSLLSSVCREIARECGGDEAAVPSEYNDLAVEFGKQLEKATAEKLLIVFLDALDQFGANDPARSLSWLPAHLPDHVRLVVSVLTDTDCAGALKTKRPEPRMLSLDKMTGPEGRTALGIWLKKAGRKLKPDQEKEVLDKFEPQGRPLYLKLAFEEARLWPSFAPKIKLQPGIPELIKGSLFARLSAPKNHGETIVSHSLGYLAASRYGLAEDELVGVLSADSAVMDDFQKRSPRSPTAKRLPVVVWSRLYFDLEPYLSEHAADGVTLLAFYHRVLGDAAAEMYLPAGSGKPGEARHSALADYFIGKADPEYRERHEADPEAIRLWEDGSGHVSVRGLSETPYHLAGADRLNDLYETLTDFNFLERKAANVGVMEHTGADGKTTKTYTGVYALQDDYAIALPKFGSGSASARKPLIVTGTDFGKGMVLRCPWCNVSSPFKQEWRGTDQPCPNCKGPLRVNSFVVGK
jgi:hypothetical protein